MREQDARNSVPQDSIDATRMSSPEADAVTVGGREDTAPSILAANAWIGRKLGRYRIDGFLGRGGMGIVYRAHDESLSRDVALKLLPADLAADPSVRERFLTEARSAAQISHPNVVSIFDVGQQGQTCFLAMELVSGGNVEDDTPAAGAYPPNEATKIIIDACRGLAAAHQTGLVHRDIKPANLLRTIDGATKLADFGLAKGRRDGQRALTLTGQVLGTPYYMSPEQCQSKPVGAQSDIYSLGATYFKLLTGHRPYGDVESELQVMFAHCHGAELDPRMIDETIPAVCGQIVKRATAKKPEERFQSAAEMLAALESALDHLKGFASSKTVIAPSTLTPASPTATTAVLTATTASPTAILSAPSATQGETVRPWWSRRTALSGGVAGLVLAALIGIALYSRSGGGRGEGDSPAAAVGPLAGGVTRDPIVFGTTTAYSGANEDLGRNMVLGIRTCFDAVNAEGGINGRALKLVVLDDGYEPERALANMRELFDEHKVFGVIGNVGTPTAKVTVPYAIEHRYLFFAPFSGASFMRTSPPERYVYHYRAGYADETAALVKYFVEMKEIPAGKIAVFAQNDSFGDEGFDGVTRALRAYGVRADDVLRVRYDRNSVRISDAVQTVATQQDQVQAVIMVATYKPAARFVKDLKEQGSTMQFAALSFVGSEAMAEEFREIGPEFADGVIVTQVVPFYHSSATGVIRYRDMLRKYHPEAQPGFVSLEGFIAAQCLVEGLKRVKGDLTTETQIDALDSIRDLDLGIGPIVSFGPSKHQVSDYVWGTVLDASAQYRTLDLQRP
jgi:serine/threonine protein kinase/ABC-type branched-subunit amino acid transport system substrate-binding protein